MPGFWKKLFIALTALLVIAFISIGGLGYKLDANRTELYVTKAQLYTTQTELDPTKTRLTKTKAQLDTAMIELKATKTQLATTEVQLNTATAQLETAEGKLTQMLDRYSYFREQINTRGGQWQDIQSYITPHDPTVSAKVKETTGGYSQDREEFWKDCARLYRWVANNIDYSRDSYMPILPELMSGNLTWTRDFWRMPAETMEEGAGDCEDTALLLASMLLNYNEGDFTVWMLGIQTYEPENRAHVAVAFLVEGGLLTILDPSANYYTCNYSGGEVRAFDVAVAIDDWLSHWEKEIPNAEIYLVFSDEFYRHISSTEEFITWVRKR